MIQIESKIQIPAYIKTSIISLLETTTEKDLSVSIKQYKKKRSLDANAYYWKLVTMLSEKIGVSKNRMHNLLLRRYGQAEIIDGQLMRIPVPDTEAAENAALEKEVYHIRPTSQVVEGKDGVMYRTYILLRGSSDYDTKEMSELIKGLISECLDAEIPENEIMTPYEKEELRQKYGIEAGTRPVKCRKRLWSVFTEDMDHCMFTGSCDVERHHIFSHTPKMRQLCERYGFIAPLWRRIHPNGVNFNPPPEFRDIDDRIKRMCQEYYEEHIGTRKEFIEEFFRSYL